MLLLVGDIGGTKTELALAAVAAERIELRAPQRYASHEHAGLEEIAIAYLATVDARPADLAGAAFAVAGPVLGGCCQTTNLPWEIDAQALVRATGLNAVRLLNDLEAIAWSVAALDATQLATLHPGTGAMPGNATVIAPGTGLGQAGLFWTGSEHLPFATEGGHTDFAPSDALEFALLQYLQERYGRVSWERVVSGLGIADLYGFFAQRYRIEHQPPLRAALAGAGDVAATVAQLAADEACPACRDTMTLFAQLLGREAGNCALKHLARAGVYIGGGIAPKNLALLQAGGFMRGFLDKGRMRPLLDAMPVRVILEQRAPLLGAARFLARG